MGRRLSLGAAIARGPALTFELDGHPVEAFAGETVAAALIAADVTALRTTARGESRAVFCAMGVCFDCLVTVDGVANTRACLTWVRAGMDVRLQNRLPPVSTTPEAPLAQDDPGGLT